MSTVAQVDATERKARFLQGPIVDKGVLSARSALQAIPIRLGNGNGGDDTQGPSACAPGHTSDSGVQCCRPKERPAQPQRPDDTNDSGTQCCGGPGHTSDSGVQCCPAPKPPQPKPPQPKS
jgi:hypothetical protein